MFVLILSYVVVHLAGVIPVAVSFRWIYFGPVDTVPFKIYMWHVFVEEDLICADPR
jgi:hypothetical protein